MSLVFLALQRMRAIQCTGKGLNSGRRRSAPHMNGQQTFLGLPFPFDHPAVLGVGYCVSWGPGCARLCSCVHCWIRFGIRSDSSLHTSQLD